MKRTPLRPGSRALERRTPLTRARKFTTRKVSKRFAARRDRAYCAWIRTRGCCVPAMPRDVALARMPSTRYRGPAWLDCWPHSRMVADLQLGLSVSECAHVRTRAAGGADRGNTVPLCKRHHAQQHAIGIKSFQANYGLDLSALAVRLAVRYDEQEAAA